MTEYSFAELPRWVSKIEKIQDAVVRTATGDMLADIEIVPGKTRGGTPKRGEIPRMDGALAKSLQSELFGSTAMTRTGEASHSLVTGSMKAGDIAKFSWGGATAPHAARRHYGFTGTDSLGRTYNEPGTFWIDVAAGKWRSYVAAAVAKAKAEITR